MTLSFIYYPVSFIMWCWHWVFGNLLGQTNAIGWALSIVFLVFTLRAVLLKPAIHQVRSMRRMQAFAPEMKKIQKKYANDKQRQAQEMQKLQREHGVNPLGGCLPMLLQIPVFIGLNHVLRSFRPGTTEVYFFHAHDVHNYLAADLFGAHLGDAILGIGSWGGTPGWHWGVAPVAIPLMIAASVATHFTARLSVSRQLSTSPNGTPQGKFMQQIQLYIFPLGVLVFGGGFPIGLLLYWLSNNGWTLGQQAFVFRRMDQEEAEEKEKALEARAALAPKVGQKPGQVRRRPAGAATAPSGTVSPTPGTKPVPGTKPAPGAKPTAGAKKPAAGAKPAPGSKPAPGAKPIARPGIKPAPGAKPNPAARSGAAKPAAQKPDTSKPGSAKANGNAAAPKNGSTNGAAQLKQPAKAKVDGRKSTSGAKPANGSATPQVSGLGSGRFRRNKQDRKDS